jgi:hypothetical protein
MFKKNRKKVNGNGKCEGKKCVKTKIEEAFKLLESLKIEVNTAKEEENVRQQYAGALSKPRS